MSGSEIGNGSFTSICAVQLLGTKVALRVELTGSKVFSGMTARGATYSLPVSPLCGAFLPYQERLGWYATAGLTNTQTLSGRPQNLR